MSRKFFLIGFLMLSLGLLGITTQAAAQSTVSINPLAESCVFNNTGTCAYTPNPASAGFCCFGGVIWSNATGTAMHTATGDALGNSTTLMQPSGCGANDWSTGVLLPGESSSVISFCVPPPNTSYTNTYHCSIHPTTMGGTIFARGETVTTTTRTTTPPTTTTTTTTTSTTTTTDCNQNNGKDKDKGKGHDKGKCKGHGKD